MLELRHVREGLYGRRSAENRRPAQPGSAWRDEFVIERKGKALAALVPVERLEQMRRFARRQALDFMNEQKGAGGVTEKTATDVSLEAQAWARKRSRKQRLKVK